MTGRQVGPQNREQASVKVNCWCDTRIVTVPAADVRSGLTLPCKEEHCIRMDKRARHLHRMEQKRVDL